MTIAFWCVLVMTLLPYVFNQQAKKGMPMKNNRSPREYLAELEGKAKRADWAHQNTLEALPGFAAAVIIAHVCNANQDHIDITCGIYIGLRIAYGFFYIIDKHILRSLAWMSSMACIIALFIISIG